MDAHIGNYRRAYIRKHKVARSGSYQSSRVLIAVRVRVTGNPRTDSGKGARTGNPRTDSGKGARSGSYKSRVLIEPASKNLNKTISGVSA